MQSHYVSDIDDNGPDNFMDSFFVNGKRVEVAGTYNDSELLLQSVHKTPTTAYVPPKKRFSSVAEGILYCSNFRKKFPKRVIVSDVLSLGFHIAMQHDDGNRKVLLEEQKNVEAQRTALRLGWSKYRRSSEGEKTLTRIMERNKVEGPQTPRTRSAQSGLGRLAQQLLGVSAPPDIQIEGNNNKFISTADINKNGKLSAVFESGDTVIFTRRTTPKNTNARPPWRF